MEGDSRNNRGKGVGKHSYSAKEQKRIDDIKLKKEQQKEHLKEIEKQKQKEANPNSQSEIDPYFGVRMGKKLKNKVKDKEYDF